MAVSGSARSNVYTVLALIALLALIVAVGFLWYKSSELFGDGSPFDVRVVSVVLDPLRALFG